jgi:hypothetical protein
MGRTRSTGLSVFKGREAKLNRAIFRNLALEGPQMVYDLHKNVRTTKILRRTYYGNVNRRVRALEQLGYIKAIGTQKTKAGFKAMVYEMTAKAHLAILLDSINLDIMLDRVSEDSALGIIAMLATLT